jgi:hypothetical protein
VPDGFSNRVFKSSADFTRVRRNFGSVPTFFSNKQIDVKFELSLDDYMDDDDMDDDDDNNNNDNNDNVRQNFQHLQ